MRRESFCAVVIGIVAAVAASVACGSTNLGPVNQSGDEHGAFHVSSGA